MLVNKVFLKASLTFNKRSFRVSGCVPQVCFLNLSRGHIFFVARCIVILLKTGVGYLFRRLRIALGKLLFYSLELLKGEMPKGSERGWIRMMSVGRVRSCGGLLSGGIR